jgi:hypothetical protein
MAPITLTEFMKTEAFRRLRYQRSWYLVRPVDSEELGMRARFVKQGISRTDLGRRLRSYRTYWASGVEILAAAAVRQPEEGEGCDAEAISVVERAVLDRVKRVRPNIETLWADQADAAIDAVRRHPLTFFVWEACGKKIAG